MFLTNQDYEVVVGKTAMDVISRCSETVKANAEAEAQEEIACYLRPDYDADALFAAEYGARNPKIVQIAVDIALYHMASSLPQKMGMDIRKERYDAALDWLKGVRAGNLVPDLARPEEGDGGAASGAGTIYITEKKLRHNW